MELGHVIFIAGWIYFIYRALSQRKRKRPKQIELPEQIPKPAPAKTDVPYDFEALRKKIRKSWGQDTEDTAMDLPDEMEKPVYKEPARVAAETVEIGKTEGLFAPDAKKQQGVHDTPLAMGASIAVSADTPAAVIAKSKAGKWDEEDARRWIVYDAIFGKPRAKRPIM